MRVLLSARPLAFALAGLCLSSGGWAAPSSSNPASGISPSSSGYESVFKSYSAAATPASSPDKAWIPANRTVRDIDQMGMGMAPADAGASSPAMAGMAPMKHDAPSSGSTASKAMPPASQAHPGHDMKHMGH